MKALKIAIVDDEGPARAELRTLLAALPFIEIAWEAANARQALKLCHENRPQLLLLDIEMPGQNGFEFVEALPLPHPQVIFTTAYDAFALRAFAVNALDYLMKPIHPRRLKVALEKARDRSGPSTGPLPQLGPGAGTLNQDDRVLVRDGKRCWFLPVGSIPLLEAKGNHTRIHFADGAPLLHRTLAAMEERLPPKVFLRANRSQLVNLSFIESVTERFGGGLAAKLRGGTQVEFSRRQARIFRARLSL